MVQDGYFTKGIKCPSFEKLQSHEVMVMHMQYAAEANDSSTQMQERVKNV